MSRYALADARVLDGGGPVRVVTLYAPGFTLHASTEAFSADDPTQNGPRFIDATLIGADDFDPEVDLFSGERAEITRSRVEMVFPEDVAPMSLDATHQHLAAATCEIAEMWPGQAWRDRHVILGGAQVSNLDLGLAGEPVRFVAESVARKAGAPVGDATRLIGDVRIDKPGAGFDSSPPVSAYSSLDGKEFPWVIGRCYKIPAYKFGEDWALGDETGVGTILCVAGHRFGNLGTLTFYDDGVQFTPAGSGQLYNNTDLAGDDLACVQGDFTDFTNADGAITVDCPNGGVQAIETTESAVNADGVLRWLLATSGVPVDWIRMRPTLMALAGWDIGVYVDRQTDALKILRERVATILPIIEEQGPAGLWYRLADPYLQPPVADLVHGLNLVGRIGGLSQVSDPDDIRNSLTLYYSYDHQLGRYTKTVRVDHTNHPLCALSKQLYGERVATSINCNVVWDDFTASAAVTSKIVRQCLPRFEIQYLADPSLYDLAEGTVVRLTDDDLGYERRRCVLRKLSASMSPFHIWLEPVPETQTAAGG